MGILLLIAAVCLLAQETPLIDLAASPSNPGKFRKTTNLFIGPAFGNANPPPPPKLPWKVRLERIEATPDQPTQKIIQILITNTADQPYALPVGRDGDAALRQENRGRRELWFGLLVNLDQSPFLRSGPAFSSADLPTSVIMIPPNGTARIRFKLDAQRARNNWRVEGKGGIPVRVRCVEHSYDDHPSEYVIRHPAPDAISENELILPLVPEDVPKGPED